MTESLYHIDSYQQTFTACVAGLDEGLHGVVLDRTAFYPGGGGQPCDHGTMAVGDICWNVEKVAKTGNGIVHILAGGQPLPGAGSVVEGRLDWARRYRLMRTHTAMHILCGVVFRDYGALVTGGEMDLQQSRMDFEFEALTRDLVKEIENSVNTEVEKDLPVWVKLVTLQEARQIPDLIRTKTNLLPEGITVVRTVEICGLDMQADGGTHVASTGEVGIIRVVDYKSKGRINKRLYIEIS